MMSSNTSFSKKEAIDFGFKAVKADLFFFIKLSLVWVIIYIVTILTNSVIHSPKGNPFLSLFIIASYVLQTIISMGFITISLKVIRRKKPAIKDLFPTSNLLKYIFGSLLYGWIVIAGFILLIIPGIIWAVKFRFYSYLIVDKGLGPFEALKESSKMTKGVKWNLFLFSLLLVLVNVLGFLALVVGLFIAIPTTMIANAFVYQKLLSVKSS